MIKVVILSQHYEQFTSLILAYNLSQAHEKIEIICATDQAEKIPFEQTQVLLADPLLASKIIDQCPHLLWLQSTWAGVNALINNEKKDYQLTGLKDIFGVKMSEYVFAYLLYFARNINAFHHLQKAQQWKTPLISALSGKTLGIMGLGNIGKSVAKTAKAFDMKVHGLSRSAKVISTSLVDACYTQAQLSEFAQSCDFIVNLLPQTHETTGMCDSAFFANMTKGSIFINAGRGSVIDQTDSLVDALNSHHLSSAVIDVCELEPLPDKHPFWTTPNLHLTNHTAALSSPDDVFNVFIRNTILFAKQAPLNYVVDQSKGY